MNETDIRLLENVFDSLDRLFDRESNTVDVFELLFATQKALSNTNKVPDLSVYVEGLSSIVRSGESKQQQREKALEITDSLRGILNEILPTT